MIRSLSWVAALVIGLQVAGCYTDYGPVVVAMDPIATTSASAPIAITSPSTRIQVGDRIKVTVYGEDNLNGVYDVDAAGNVSLPLAGTIRAAGRSKLDLEREITRRYRSDFLQDPKVTVDHASSRPFYVMGEAEKPGEYPYRHGLTVISAIATAGGATYRASRSHVLIQHAGHTAWIQYPLLPEVPVAPGDIIRLPERYF
jgi:protein involved in polysaccharide export with SLBB domain